MLVLDAPILRYGRPLKIRDFVQEIKYWGLQMLNKNVKSRLLYKKKNKKDLPAMYPTLFWRLLINSLDFWAQLQNHCNSPHKTSPSSLLYFSSYKVSYFQWSPVTRHQCVHYKGHVSPMACKLLYTPFSCDGVEYLCNDAFLCLFEGKWCSTFSSVILKRMKPSVINRYHKMMKGQF